MTFFWIVFGLCYVVHTLCKENFGVGLLAGLGEIIFAPAYKKEPNFWMPNEEEPKWDKDEFVGYCTFPLLPKKLVDDNNYAAIYEIGLEADGMVNADAEFISSKECTLSGYDYFEVYQKEDGTYYAWPCWKGLNSILKGNIDCFQGSTITKRKSECYYTSVDLLRFYFDIPSFSFVNKSISAGGDSLKQVETPGIWFRLARGSRPLIVERVSGTNEHLTPRHDGVYYYRPVSKGHLRVFFVKRDGDNGKEYKDE